MSTVLSIDKQHAGLLIGALAQSGAKREGEEFAFHPKSAKNKSFYLYFQKTPVREPKKPF